MQMTIAAGTQDLWAALSIGRKQAAGGGAAAFSPFKDRGAVVEVTPLKREIMAETQSGSDSFDMRRQQQPLGLAPRSQPLTYSAPRAAQAAPALHYANAERGSLVDVYA
jgi:hypothetical protein